MTELHGKIGSPASGIRRGQLKMGSMERIRITKAVRSPEIPAAQHHRAHVRLAKGEPQDRHSLRQAGKKFCRDGHAGLHAAVFASVLFVQNLVPVH